MGVSFCPFFMLAELFLQTALGVSLCEVPRWPQENHCYSCHNNGDAARALYSAERRGYVVPEMALADTTAFLMAANRDEIHGAPAASDKKLARIQFGAALAEAYHSGAIRDDGALRAAAESLVKLQDPDGWWDVDTGGLPGSPATYGTALATYMTRRTLVVAGGRNTGNHRNATRWLETAHPHRRTWMRQRCCSRCRDGASAGRCCATRRRAMADGDATAHAGRGVRHRDRAARARRPPALAAERGRDWLLYGRISTAVGRKRRGPPAGRATPNASRPPDGWCTRSWRWKDARGDLDDRLLSSVNAAASARSCMTDHARRWSVLPVIVFVRAVSPFRVATVRVIGSKVSTSKARSM